MENQSTSVNPTAESVLNYEGPRDFERAIFRLVGILAILIATSELLQLLIELLRVYSMELPAWWIINRRVYSDGQWWSLRWIEQGYPLTCRLLAIILLAGSIGMLRRDVRTRFWMISYAVCALTAECLTFIVSSGMMTYIKAMTFPKHFSWYVRLLQCIEERTARFIFPTIVLYLMTRRGVGKLFAKNPYGDG